MLDKGYVEQAPFVASVNADLCRGSAKCLEECAYQNAISLVEMEIDGQVVRRAEVNAALCTGCGMCVPACPERAIEVEGSRIEQFDAMVEALAAGG